MLDDSISTKKEERKKIIQKNKNNREQNTQYSKWLILQGNWKGTYE